MFAFSAFIKFFLVLCFVLLVLMELTHILRSKKVVPYNEVKCQVAPPVATRIPSAMLWLHFHPRPLQFAEVALPIDMLKSAIHIHHPVDHQCAPITDEYPGYDLGVTLLWKMLDPWRLHCLWFCWQDTWKTWAWGQGAGSFHGSNTPW